MVEKSAEILDGDLIDRIVDYLAAEFPSISSDDLSKIGAAMRAEFRGEQVYIASRSPTKRQRLVGEVLALFNGRNASEVARRLSISRATVYRTIKQHGGKVSQFSGNATGTSVRSDDGIHQ